MFFNFRRNDQKKNFQDLVRRHDLGDKSATDELLQIQRIEGEDVLFERMDEARIAIYSNAAEQGDEKALYWMGVSLLRRDPKQALAYLSTLAEKGNTQAMKQIACNFSEFGAFGENPEASLFWYMQAAECGDAEAMYHVGLEYRCKSDHENAYIWYKKASDAGNIDGKIGLAKCLREKIYEIDFQNANDRASVENELVDLDAQAEELLIESANHGDKNQSREATFELGSLYSSTIPGPPDYQSALFFYYQSYLFGNDYALKAFEDLQERTNIQISDAEIKRWEADFQEV